VLPVVCLALNCVGGCSDAGLMMMMLVVAVVPVVSVLMSWRRCILSHIRGLA
jgi:hypothetical protein